MRLRGRYKSKFDVVSDIVWLSLCVVAVVVWFAFFHHRFEGEVGTVIFIIFAVLFLRPLATFLTRRLGVAED